LIFIVFCSSFSFISSTVSLIKFFILFSIGTRHFWRAAHFNAIYDSEGERHDVYRTNGESCIFLLTYFFKYSKKKALSWIDCMTPSLANYFYILIALCFVIVFASSFASALNIFLPPFGFFQWLRKNTLLEVCSMALSLLACVTLLLAECQYVSNVKTGVIVSIGSGLFLVAASGVSSFFAAVASLRRTNRLALSRRLQNQQMLCARSLLSWHDVGRQPEDTRAIMQFEEYLDSTSSNSALEKELPFEKI
uniref:TMEM127 domain-containing protein n=1 Tax=Enterobius vermicularis TaxID=51028 RepID=A0A0N4VAA1_ENTVE